MAAGLSKSARSLIFQPVGNYHPGASEVASIKKVVKYTSVGVWSIMNLSEKKFWFRAPRGRHGPKLKIRKRPKKLSAPNFRIFFFKNLYCPKGPFSTYKKFGFPFFDFGELSRKPVFYLTPKATSGVWSLLDWNS